MLVILSIKLYIITSGFLSGITAPLFFAGPPNLQKTLIALQPRCLTFGEILAFYMN
jgi:hypothetical protein